MIFIVVKFPVKPEHADAWPQIAREFTEATRAEPGNIRFDLLADPEDENRFHCYEIFADEAALDAHRATEHYRRCVELIGPLTTGSRSKRFFSPVLVEGAAGERAAESTGDRA